METIKESFINGVKKRHKSLRHAVNNFSIKDWNEVTFQLLENSQNKKDPNFKALNNSSVVNSFIWVNNSLKETHFKDLVWEVNFDNFYPQIAHRSIQDFPFNHSAFPNVWTGVYDVYEDLDYFDQNTNTNLKDLLKIWINWSFGAINNGATDIKCSADYRRIIKKRANSNLKEILDRFKELIVYIETDQVFLIDFPENSEIQDYLNTLGLKWSAKAWNDFIAIDNKNYVGTKDGEFNQRGFKNVGV